MKISFFIGGMGPGGAERVISILANDYCARGWDVEIVLLLKNEVIHPLNERIKIIDLTGKSGSYFKNATYWLKSIRKYLKKVRPNVVVSFIGRINALVLTASLGMKMPIVVSERNDPRHDGRGVLMQAYCNWIYRRAKAIVYQSDYEKSCFAPYLADKGCIVPNPVRVTTQRKKTADFTIATAGRLTEQKNQIMLVRAMARIHAKHPELKCRIFGDGVLRDTLQQEITYLGLQDVVFLEGNVQNIHERLAECGIFALTSNFEGLSNALIEAMMVGLTCITTDYPGARELIIHERNGIVVPMDDDAALAMEIEKLLQNPQCAEKLSCQGQADAEKFKTDSVLKLWHAVIEG